MANIQFGVAIADARGSVGGNVFSRGRGGAILRNRVKPVNPRSALQNVRRGQQSFLSRYWSQTLTVQERADWNAYAAGTTWTNKLGQSIEINGNAAFMRLNSLLLLIGVAVREGAPTAMGHAGGITLAFDAESDTSNIEVAEPGGAFDKDLDGDYVILFQALPVSGGRAAGTKGFRYIGYFEGDSVAAPTFPQDIASAYTMVDGQIATCRAIHIDPDFRVSSAVYQSEIVAASA